MYKEKSSNSGIIWYSVGMTAYLGCQWLLSIVVVHLSGYATAGNLSIAMSVSNLFSLGALFGVRNFQVSDTRDEIPASIYVTSRVITTIAAYVAIVGYVFLNGYDYETASAILLYCLFRISEAVVDVFHGINQKKGRLDVVGKSHALRGAAFLTAFTAALALGGDLNLALVTMLLSVVPIVLFFDYPVAVKLGQFRLVWNWHQIRELLGHCFPLVLYKLLLTVTGILPRQVLELVHGSEALGYYASIATPTLIVQVSATYLFNPAIPAFSEALYRGEKKQFTNLFRKISILITCLALLSLIASKLLGEFALVLLFGEGIKQYIYVLDLAIVSTIIIAYVWFLCTVLTVLREKQGLVIANAASLIVCAVVSKPFIQKFSMQGVNYSNLLSLGVAVLILWIYYRKNLKRKFG